jgi:hypothetical protein
MPSGDEIALATSADPLRQPRESGLLSRLITIRAKSIEIGAISTPVPFTPAGTPPLRHGGGGFRSIAASIRLFGVNGMQHGT